MPTYDYECANGHTFERFESIRATGRARCPQCKKMARRLIGGGGGLIFKGSGFYTTDYRSPEYKAKADADAGKACPKKADCEKAGGKAPCEAGGD